MASINWPASLPTQPLHQGYAQRRQSAVIRSKNGYGPAKVRRRVSSAIEPMNASFRLNRTDMLALRTFYNTTTAEGVLPFNFTDPLSAATVDLRFTAPIQYSSSGPDLFLCVCNFEVLP